MKMGKSEDSKFFYVLVWVSGCRLVLVFGAALFVVSGVCLPVRVCALAPSFFGLGFSLVCFSRAQRQGHCCTVSSKNPVCGRVQTWDRNQRSAVDSSGSSDGKAWRWRRGNGSLRSIQWSMAGDLRAWYAPIFLLFQLLSYLWFYASNSTRFF